MLLSTSIHFDGSEYVPGPLWDTTLIVQVRHTVQKTVANRVWLVIPKIVFSEDTSSLLYLMFISVKCD